MDNWDKASLAVIGLILIGFIVFMVVLGVSFGTIIEAQGSR